jgi:pimeloyl-ACP methyl ester carboxylesterase
MTTLPAPVAARGNVSLPSEIARPAGARRVRRLLLLSMASFTFLLLVITGVHAWIAWKLTHPDIARLRTNPMAAKNLAYEEIAFPSYGHASLTEGWWIPAGFSANTVVLSHGYGANREEYWVPMYDLAEILHRQGYNVLMFDYGFASEKFHHPATGGHVEARQLLGAVDYARQRGSEMIVVWGFSMGAGTALQAALHDAPVDAMILDSTFLPNEDTISYALENLGLKGPAKPAIPLVKWFFPLMSGTSLEDLPVQRALDTDFHFPIFLIHGTADTKAPAFLAENIASAQTHPASRLWIAENALHEMIFRMHKEEYLQRTLSFLGEISEMRLGGKMSSLTLVA